MAEKQGAPWPSTIGMDEHAYGKNKEFRRTQFVTTIVNHNKGKMFPRSLLQILSRINTLDPLHSQ